MMGRLGLVIAVAISVGWVIPLFLAVRFILDWCRLEASPVVYGHARIANSFPFLSQAEIMVTTAAAWAGIATVAWLLVGIHFVVSGKAGHKSVAS